MASYLDKTGLAYLWNKIKNYVDTRDIGIADTGWIKVTTFYNGCTHYGNNTTVYVRQYGKHVQIVGAVKNTKQLNTTSYKRVMLFKLPDGISTPKAGTMTCSVQQGSGLNRFMLIVGNDGTVGIERYGTTTCIAVPENSWLNVSCTYMVE